MTRFVVKRDVCYLDVDGANRFERGDARVFDLYWDAKAFAHRHNGRVVRLVPKGTKAARIVAREKRLGIEPLGVARCDECAELAYTRWYSSLRPGHEEVAYTLCKPHNEAMIEENLRRRKECGLA